MRDYDDDKMESDFKLKAKDPKADGYSPMRKALIEGDKIASKLRDQLHELEQRLGGVLMPSDPQPKSEDTSPEDRSAPYVSELRDHNERLADMCTYVRNMINRLEV
jgi:hypothetical protein